MNTQPQPIYVVRQTSTTTRVLLWIAVAILLAPLAVVVNLVGFGIYASLIEGFVTAAYEAGELR